MNTQQSYSKGRDRSKKSQVDRILEVPGIREAIELTRECAGMSAVDKAIEQGVKGELGNKVQAILESDTMDTLGPFMTHEMVASCISENFDEKLEEFAVEASPTIAELWSLSEGARELISRLIYLGVDSQHKLREEVYASFTFFVSEKDLQNNHTFAEHYHELEERGITVNYSDQIPKGRIYLDVTELTQQHFRSGYKGIELCRKYLGLKHEDLRIGRPRSIDANRALEVSWLKKMGKSNEEIAKQLGFKIYRSVLPQGTFSHLYKYLNLGRKINERLNKLEQHLSHLNLST